MMSNEEVRQWRDIERMKYTQLEDQDERMRCSMVIQLLSAILGDDE